jgi:glucose-1-phosphate adenylyltransferase
LQNVILDNGCIVPPGSVIGFDLQSDAERFNVTREGVVLINRQMLGQGISYNPEF